MFVYLHVSVCRPSMRHLSVCHLSMRRLTVCLSVWLPTCWNVLCMLLLEKFDNGGEKFKWLTYLILP